MARLTERPFRFSSGRVTLAGTLSWPEGPPRHAAVILISGSGANDRDETVCGHKPFEVIADFLAGHGCAVLRYDDRGVGESGGDCSEAAFDGKVADAIAAFRALAAMPGVDPARIVLCGHSEGGLVASAASAVIDAPIVLLATPAGPVEEMLHYQARALSLSMGASEVQIAHELAMNRRVFAAVREAPDTQTACREAQGVIIESLRAWPGQPPGWASQDELTEAADAMAATVAQPAYRSLLALEPARLLRAVRQPILAIFGELDRQAPCAASVSAFRAAAGGNPRAEVRIFGRLNHLLQEAGTGHIIEYERLQAGPVAAVLDALLHWLESLSGRPDLPPVKPGTT